jgi:hypothetical protein
VEEGGRIGVVRRAGAKEVRSAALFLESGFKSIELHISFQLQPTINPTPT